MNFYAIMKSRWLDLLKCTFRGWMDDRAPRLSAALAYCSIFPIAPLLVIKDTNNEEIRQLALEILSKKQSDLAILPNPL